MRAMQGALAAAVSACVLATGVRAADDALAGTGRDLLERYAGAVVRIRGVLSIELPGGGSVSGGNEHEINTHGTVMGAEGLTVVSCSALNPLASMDDMPMAASSGATPKGTVSRLRMVLDDGTEIPCRLVLEDSDLDLAFLLPAPEEGRNLPALAAVPFDEQAGARVMDPALPMGRLPDLLDHRPAIGANQVVGVIGRPRVVYVLGGGYDGGIGMPVFKGDGTPLGLLVTRRTPMKRSGNRFTSQAAQVVVPGRDIVAAGRQALELGAAPSAGE